MKNRSFILVSTTFVVLVASGFIAVGGSIIDSVTISIVFYILASILYAMRRAYIRARGKESDDAGTDNKRAFGPD